MLRQIALLDDDPAFQQLLAKKLEPLQIRVEHFANPKRFLDLEDISHFALILMDLKMLDTTGVYWEFAGIEVTKSIVAKHGGYPPICIFTSHENENLVESAVENGARFFLEKSRPLEEIVDRIQAYVRDSSH